MPAGDLARDEARRIALAAQGFDRPRPRGRVGAPALRRTIRQLGLLQMDFVNVLVPAHYVVPFSRLGPYDRALLDEVVYRGREFTEQWAHEASILPVETWPLLRHRMEAHRARPRGFDSFMEKNAGYVEQVLADVRARGPLSADDLPGPEGASRRIPGAWIGTVPRAVLEAHFGRGLLAVAERRPNFARAFDLAERRLPPHHYARRSTHEESQRELLRLAARAHGVGTVADLADYYRMPVRVARARLAELVTAGELREVRVEGWPEAAYLHPQAKRPPRIEAAALLSPFDPVVWYRPRTRRLFGFDFRLEIFVPRPKRRWGYYVLPFLLGDRLVARVDLKAERALRRLHVLAAYAEPRVRPGPVAEALAVELKTMASWLKLDSIAVGRRGGLARSLAAALRA
ncbi:MAG: cytoplasmic protein [Acidobacteria bacterium]|nr:MAG: cytoplasmic protein [Acidobacteriota bacterium]